MRAFKAFALFTVLSVLFSSFAHSGEKTKPPAAPTVSAEKAATCLETVRDYLASIVDRLNGKPGAKNPDTTRNVAVKQLDKAIKELRKGSTVDSPNITALAAATTSLENIKDFGLDNGGKEAVLDTIKEADEKIAGVLSSLASPKVAASAPGNQGVASSPTELYKEKPVEVSVPEANKVKALTGFTLEEIQKMPVSGRLDLAEDSVKKGDKDAAFFYLHALKVGFGANAGRLQVCQSALAGLDLKDKQILTYRRELDAFKQAGGPSLEAVREAITKSEESETQLKTFTSRIGELDKKHQEIAKERDTATQKVAQLTEEADKQKEALAAAAKEKEAFQQQLAATEPLKVERDTLQKKVGELEGELKAKAGMLSLTQYTVTRLQVQLAETEKLVGKTKTNAECMIEIELALARLEKTFGISKSPAPGQQ